MPKKPLTILGINPGSKYLGIAIFQGHELRDWRIKTFKGKWSKEKMKKVIGIIYDFICQYNPSVLALKEFTPSRSSHGLNRLIMKIKDLAKKERMKIYEYSIKDLEAFFSPEGRINKRQLAEVVASKYLVLFNELNKEKAHRNPYHIRMFEAVALASVCFHQLDNH